MCTPVYHAKDDCNEKKKFACAALALTLAASMASAGAVSRTQMNKSNDNQALSAASRIQIFPIYLGQGYCTGDGVRVRKGQGTSYAVVGTLYKGDFINYE